MATTTPELQTKTCHRCGETKPLIGGFSPSKKARDGHAGICTSCDSRRKRALEQAHDGDPQWFICPEDPPDPGPARRLRESLVISRQAGTPFSDAWSLALVVALGGLKITEAKEWSATFSWSRATWAAAYRRSGMPFRCSPLLLDD